MPLWTTDETLSPWKPIETDGVPDSDLMVLTAIVWGSDLEPDYGVGMFQDGEWWHTCADDVPPTHWADFERLPASALGRSPDTSLAIAGLKFSPDEVCPKPAAYIEDSKETARKLVAAINEQIALFGVLAGEIQADGGVVTFKYGARENSAVVSRFQANKPSNAYAGCKFCHGSGCLACPGERRKAEASRAKAESDRKARLAAMTPEQILAELPDIRAGVLIACGFAGKRLTGDEVDALAKDRVLQNLQDGGHEFPIPDPVFTVDPSNPQQWEEFKQLFHYDRLKQAGQTKDGFQQLMEEAKAVMQARTEAPPND